MTEVQVYLRREYHAYHLGSDPRHQAFKPDQMNENQALMISFFYDAIPPNFIRSKIWGKTWDQVMAFPIFVDKAKISATGVEGIFMDGHRVISPSLVSKQHAVRNLLIWESPQ